MIATLQAKFGHEENLSRHLLENGALARFLKRAGFKAAGSGQLELRVAHGAPGCEGRLDIHQPTTAGTVIVEVQYGTSDTNHRKRFPGYAKSVSNAAAIIWIAESFRGKDLELVAKSRVPVVCVKAKLATNGEVKLAAIGGARLSAQSIEQREQRATRQAWKWVKAVDWEEKWMDELVRWRCGDIDEVPIEQVYSYYAFSTKGPTSDKRLAQCKASPEWGQMLEFIKQGGKRAAKRFARNERIRPVVLAQMGEAKSFSDFDDEDAWGRWWADYSRRWDETWKAVEIGMA